MTRHGPRDRVILVRWCVLAGSSRPGEGWGVSPPEDCARRSIYGYAKRNLALPLLDLNAGSSNLSARRLNA